MSQVGCSPIKFEGIAHVVPASSESNPDAYLEIGAGSAVIRVGYKGDASLQAMADALNLWAGKEQEVHASR